MKQKITPKILPGFMELLPAEQLVFEKIKSLIAMTYESFGFIPLDTPILEVSEVLLAKAGGETEKQIYRFNKGDNDICMRFDLTVPLARYVSQHQNELNFPFRRYQIAKVYRGERPQRGRFREFYQADIDIIGSEKLSVLYDAEIPAIMYQVFMKLGLKRFHIRMNNRKLLKGFYESINLVNQSADILRVIDKMDKIGLENVTACLEDLALSPDEIKAILDFTAIEGSVESVLARLEALKIDNEDYQIGLSELKTVISALTHLGIPQTHYQIDLKITRGLDYYTGTVYETFVDDFPGWGSICSGGRYDNLAGYYTDRKLPGVGMSIGLTRFFDLLRSAGLIQTDVHTPVDIVVIPMDEKTNGYALKVARLIREGGLKAEVYAAETKFKNKMAYANKIGVSFVAVLGDEEKATNTVTLKNMKTGKQEKIVAEKVAAALRLATDTGELSTMDAIIKRK